MPTKILVGACNPSVYEELCKHFKCQNKYGITRIAIPASLVLPHWHGSEFWDYKAELPTGEILATHTKLHHIEFGTHDELLDKGIMLEELLND